MWLVKRNTLEKIRVIQSNIKMVLLRYFVENQTVSLSQKQEITALLHEARDKGYWLACNCIVGAIEPPLMYVRQHETGQLSLVRMPNRTAHQFSCAFKFTEKQEEDNRITSSQIKSWNKEQPLNLHRSLETTLASRNELDEEKSDSTSHSTRIPRLGRLLYTLLTDAGLTKIQPERLTLSEQFNNIKKSASSYFLANQISLTDYFWTFPTQIGFAAIQLKKNKAQWPKSIRPYGVFVLLVERFENNVAFCCQHHDKTISIPLLGNLAFSSGRLSENKGPFLLLFTFTDSTTKKDNFNPMNGFAVPIHSHYLLTPVESHYERQVLQKLIQLTQTFRKKNIQLTIEKPLFDITVNKRDTLVDCRPDFLLKTDTRCVVLEVMGSNEEHYLERKIRTHQTMQQLGELISFDANATEKLNQWNEKLDELCKQIYRVLL